MSKYRKALMEAIRNRGIVEKGDAYDSITFNEVYDSFSVFSREDVQELAQDLFSAYRSIPAPKGTELMTEYNSVRDYSKLTQEELLYIKGELGMMLNIVNMTLSKRPTRKELKVGRDNIEILTHIKDAEFVEYKSDSSMAQLYESGLITSYMYGETRVCRLTPFGNDLIANYENVVKYLEKYNVD